MKTLRAAFAVSTIFFLVACGDSGTGGTGGRGGSSGGAAAGAGGGTGGSGSGSAGASGAAGASGTAGATGTGGGQGSCQACVACINANCASAVTSCRANAGCSAIYDCASACVMTIQQCVGGDVAAALMWAQTVSGCYTSTCRTQCMY